jgi:anti-anti-sigma factor
MNPLDADHLEQLSYQCPVCGNPLPHLAPAPPFDAPCSECGSVLWCRRRVSPEHLVLEALPSGTPEPWQVEQVVESLLSSGRASRVVLDLSHLNYVSSSFVARLVTMNRRIRATGGRLVLCGLHPVAYEIFQQFRLDKLFEILPEDRSQPSESPQAVLQPAEKTSRL